jgi:hypothetical protein
MAERHWSFLEAVKYLERLDPSDAVTLRAQWQFSTTNPSTPSAAAGGVTTGPRKRGVTTAPGRATQRQKGGQNHPTPSSLRREAGAGSTSSPNREI